MLNIFEITPKGETLTNTSRNKIIEVFFSETNENSRIIFNSGTDFTNPQRILSEAKKGDYLLFVDKKESNVVLLKWNNKLKKEFISSTTTSYETLANYISKR